MNFTQDSHIHTFYSPDADPQATFEAYIKEAQAKGLQELTFTDHVDFDAVHPLFHSHINYDDYIKTFKMVQKTSPIPIKLGVEIGYQAHVKDEINAFLQRYSFDFVILSVHYIQQKDLYTKEYFIGKTKHESYQLYFETILDAVKNIPTFNVVGHLDYITRYSPFGDYDYSDYKDIIDTILQALISRNKGIEINTSGYKTEQRPYPKKEVIKRYIELGGSHLTLGSDAHRVSELGREFNRVRLLLN